MENEIWKDVVGYEGLYRVSDKGRVRSLDKVVTGMNGTPRRNKGLILKPAITSVGYPLVSLRKDGKYKTWTVHRIVALAFLPNPDNKRTVNHIDGIKHNNDLSNLEWATHKENSEHAWETGLSKIVNPNKNGKVQGENSYASKLTDEAAVFIRNNYIKNGGNLTETELARKYGVSPSTIGQVVNFESWKHVGGKKPLDENYIISKTGFKYVFANGNRFQGRFAHNKVKHHCGSFRTPEEAHEAVMEKRREMNLE